MRKRRVCQRCLWSEEFEAQSSFGRARSGLRTPCLTRFHHILSYFGDFQGFRKAFRPIFGARKRQKLAPDMLQSLYNAESEEEFVRMARERLAEGSTSRRVIDFRRF